MGNNNNNNNFNNNHNHNNNPNNNNNNHNNNQQLPTTPIITPPLPETTTERDDRIIGITVPRVTPTQSTTTTTTTPKTTPSVGNRCRSPDGEEGTCKALENCEHLLNRLRSNTNDETFKTYLRSSNSVCQSVGTDVCCASPTDRLVTPAPEIDIRRLPTEEEGCGFVNNKFNKVVGGEDSQIGAWPWMALIGYNAWSLAPFKCGGTLVSARHVITAAHCLRSDLSFVRLGEHDLSTETETRHVDIDVEKSLRHPGFNRDGRHDLAILYLVKNVEKTESILPICMPTSTHLRTKSYLRSNPFVAGWGRTMEGGSSSQVLQQLQIPVLENSVCQDSFKANGRVISPNQFDDSILCAGILVGGRDTCQGDSGGPLMIPELYKGITRYYLIGVVSYGIGCARVGVPGVYTSIQYTDHMDWITQRIAET